MTYVSIYGEEVSCITFTCIYILSILFVIWSLVVSDAGQDFAIYLYRPWYGMSIGYYFLISLLACVISSCSNLFPHWLSVYPFRLGWVVTYVFGYMLPS